MLLSYNQESFIQEALKGAFSQTYTPLQIIISDDCSTDLTYKIIQETASQYTGPHEIILNCNSRNIGITEHLNHIMQIAQGELIVLAAGDDVSLPTRTSELVSYWLSTGKHYTSLTSYIISIDAEGHILDATSQWEQHVTATPEPKASHDLLSTYLHTHRPQAMGCSHAYVPSLFTIFGPLPAEVAYEDSLLTFRSHLLSGMGIVRKQLVLYRTHSGCVSNKPKFACRTIPDIQRHETQSYLTLVKTRALYNAYLCDLDKAHALTLLSSEHYAHLQCIVLRRIHRLLIQLAFYNTPLFTKLRLLAYLIQDHVELSVLIRLFPRLLPRRLLSYAKLLLNTITFIK